MKNLHFIIHFLILGFFLCTLTNPALASDSELLSEHFYIIYDEDCEELAERVSRFSEQIYHRLSQQLDAQFENSIYIILHDKKDRERIDWGSYEAIFIVNDDGTSDEIIQRQIAHGMVVALSLNTSDFSPDFRSILAVIAYNNTYSPDWFSLGLADYYASAIPGALAHEPNYRQKLAKILENPISLGDLAAGNRGNPDDELNEIIGLGFITYLAETYGPQILTEWNHAHAMSVLPYTYQKTALRVFGRKWDDLFDEWIAHERALTNQALGSDPASQEFNYALAELDVSWNDILANAEPDFDMENAPETSVHEDQYRSWATLWPDEISPRIGYSENTGVVIGAEIFGEDVLNHHVYQGHVVYMTEKEHVDLRLKYLWNQFAWSIDVSAALEQNDVAWEVNRKYRSLDYMSHQAEIGTGRSWNWDDISLALRFAFLAEYKSPLNKNRWYGMDPKVAPVWLPAMGWTNAVIAELKFSRLQDAPHILASTQGYRARFLVHLEAPYWGAQNFLFLNRLDFNATWVMPYYDRHSITLDFEGAYSNSDNNARYPFEIASDAGFSFNNPVDLHGYPEGSAYGKHFIRLNMNYSAVIAEFHAGFDSFPFGINRFGMTLYGDSFWGVIPASDSNSELKDQINFKTAAGLELHFDLMLGWHIPARLSLGGACGFSDGGDLQYYLSLAL